MKWSHFSTTPIFPSDGNLVRCYKCIAVPGGVCCSPCAHGSHVRNKPLQRPQTAARHHLSECACSVGITTLPLSSRSRFCLIWTTHGRCGGALRKLPRRLQSDSADVTERHTGGGGGAAVIQFKWASPPSSCKKLWFTVYFFQNLIRSSSPGERDAPPFVYCRYRVSVNHAAAMFGSDNTMGCSRSAAFFYLLPVSISPSA